MKGGQIGLWSGDLGALHDDMQVLRPTHFGSTPVFWLAHLQKFNAELRQAAAAAAAVDDVDDAGGNTAADAMSGKGKLTDENARATVVQQWKGKRLLGNRCKSVLLGGAPSSDDLKRWIWELFGCSVVDGYGKVGKSTRALFKKTRCNPPACVWRAQHHLTALHCIALHACLQ